MTTHELNQTIEAQVKSAEDAYAIARNFAALASQTRRGVFVALEELDRAAAHLNNVRRQAKALGRSFCSTCGSLKPVGQSCGCFDNGCQ